MAATASAVAACALGGPEALVGAGIGAGALLTLGFVSGAAVMAADSAESGGQACAMVAGAAAMCAAAGGAAGGLLGSFYHFARALF